MKTLNALLAYLFMVLVLAAPLEAAVASNNLSLESPVYQYLDKLAGLGLITSDFKGIRPLTRSEAARLYLEAEQNSTAVKSAFADALLAELKTYLKRELALSDNPAAAPAFDLVPLSSASASYIYLDGSPRNYERPVHDQGGEGVFGIGAGLRPVNSSGANAMQRGSEGTPLSENNEGVVYRRGSSLDLRVESELYVSSYFSGLLEPMFLSTDGAIQGRLNKGYAKLGGGGLELEIGRDANWLGFGERGALTLSNNAANFDMVKLSSPEPLSAGFLGEFKYAFILSRFDKVMTVNGERQPYFYAIKGSLKPVPNFEIGINLGRQQGGPGVNNSLRDNFQGLVGGTNSDNSNSLGGVELRWRLDSLRNTELFVEFSGEDAAKFWPFVESYLAGIYIPRLTDDGRNDFRFEYFLGNPILYAHGQFSEGYIYNGLPVGHSQGGATQDFFFRYRHWMAVREFAGVDYIHTTRGNTGRVDGQSLERLDAIRAFWHYPLAEKLDLKLVYGWEKVENLNLVGDAQRTNNIATAELSCRF